VLVKKGYSYIFYVDGKEVNNISIDSQYSLKSRDLDLLSSMERY